MEELLAASELTDINDLIINEEMGTVFLQQENMSLDVGAIAKGFALELASLTAIESGFDSFSLTVGGDVRVAESPPGDREAWNIGVSNPEGGDVLDIISVTNTSVFSSGNYLRYFVVDDQVFHHIIDPRTLMPATGHKSVSVVYPDGAMADILSLVAFILDTDEAKEFLAGFEAEGIWVVEDGTVTTTPGWE
jgi:thiamine biosynthesis lipoprotein